MTGPHRVFFKSRIAGGYAVPPLEFRIYRSSPRREVPLRSVASRGPERFGQAGSDVGTDIPIACRRKVRFGSTQVGDRTSGFALDVLFK